MYAAPTDQTKLDLINALMAKHGKTEKAGYRTYLQEAYNIGAGAKPRDRAGTTDSAAWMGKRRTDDLGLPYWRGSRESRVCYSSCRRPRSPDTEGFNSTVIHID